MIKYRSRRSCVLISSILTAFPLYILIFCLYNSVPGFYDNPKAVLRKFIDINYVPYTTIQEDEGVIQNKPEDVFDANLFTFTPDIKNEQILPDIDAADLIPQRELSAKQIFFVETSHPEGGFMEINAREACAIESAAIMHPDYNVFVIYAGLTAIDPDGNCTKIVKNIMNNYPNVHFRSIDPVKFSMNTPMEKFFKSGKYKNSKHFTTHLADILRLVALWKYGGLYFDLDVVVVRNHKELGENFLGAATHKMVMSGTMQFSGFGIGHDFVEQCLDNVAKNFRGGSWASNGPDLITRIMQRFCNRTLTAEMTEENCQGMKVLARKLFLPVWYPSHKIYFEPRYADMIFGTIKNSYTAHIFNHMNHHFKLYKGSRAAYLKLAEKFCPIVYDTLEYGEPF